MTPAYRDDHVEIWGGDARVVLGELEAESVQTVVTSPPYWGLRDYEVEGQIGLERTLEAYVEELVDVFRGVRRVLRADGTVWVNLGDSFASIGRTSSLESPGVGAKQERRRLERDLVWHAGDGSRFAWTLPGGQKPKDLLGIPWEVAFALRRDGWYLRSEIIWSKPNPMPDSAADRPARAHEHVFLLTRSRSYFYDSTAVREGTSSPRVVRPGGWGTDSRHSTLELNRGTRGLLGNAADHRESLSAGPELLPGHNLRDVWTIATQKYGGDHFATFPERLVEPCILAGSRPGDLVLDPFAGTGTTGLVAQQLGRRAVLIDLNPDYLEQSLRRASRAWGVGGPELADVAIPAPAGSLWSDELPPGGLVCSSCGVPVESEPCEIHGAAS